MPTNTLFVAGEQRDAKRTRVNGSAMSVVFRLIRGYGGPTVVLQVVLHQMMVLRGGVAAILKERELECLLLSVRSKGVAAQVVWH